MTAQPRRRISRNDRNRAALLAAEAVMLGLDATVADVLADEVGWFGRVHAAQVAARGAGRPDMDEQLRRLLDGA